MKAFFKSVTHFLIDHASIIGIVMVLMSSALALTIFQSYQSQRASEIASEYSRFKNFETTIKLGGQHDVGPDAVNELLSSASFNHIKGVYEKSDSHSSKEWLSNKEWVYSAYSKLKNASGDYKAMAGDKDVQNLLYQLQLTIYLTEMTQSVSGGFSVSQFTFMLLAVLMGLSGFYFLGAGFGQRRQLAR